MKHRILCLFLALILVLPTLASCANNENEKDEPDNTGSIVTENEDVPVFEERDFNEETFKILTYGSTAVDYADAYIWSDGVTGGAISDAVAERNRLVEERYNVIIASEECSPMPEARKRMQAGQCDFDVIYEWGIWSSATALDGMLYDFLELDYISLDKSYWVPSAVDDLTIRGRMFLATNYITMNSLSWTQFIAFNKNLMDKLQIEYPYTYVYENNWTFDVFLDMIICAEEDMNGDGVMGVDDQFGYGTDSVSLLSALVSMAGQSTTKKNGDSYEITINTEKAQNIYNTYSKKLAVSDAFITYEDVWNAGVDLSAFESGYMGARYYIFGEDHTLLNPLTMDETKEFTNMKSDYGVVPNPKLNSSQAEYYHFVDTCAPIFSIPVQINDEDRLAVILEYMAYESERNLLPAYYETTIKTKRMQDNRDYEMLDIIRSTAHYDWTTLYKLEGTAGLLDQMMTSGSFASVWRRNGAKAQSSLDELLDKIENISY